MHPRLAEVSALLHRERAALLATLDRVPPDARDVRPAGDAWSVAEVLEHLAIVEGGSARLLARRLERAREAGIGGETSTTSVLGRVDAQRFVSGDRLDAPELVRPSGTMSADAACTALHASRDALDAFMRDADGVALGEVKAQHARFGELDAYQWLLFVAHHETRHARQLERIAAALAARDPA